MVGSKKELSKSYQKNPTFVPLSVETRKKSLSISVFHHLLIEKRMNMFTRSFSTSVTRFPSALKKLSQHGVEALKPSVRMVDNSKVWIPPLISRRKAAALRKEAIQNGSFGSFVANQGGWEPAWDLELLGRSKGRFPSIRPPKLPRHQRNREERAKKIEQKLVGMDERIEEYYQEKHDAKPAKTFENRHKAMMQIKKK